MMQIESRKLFQISSIKISNLESFLIGSIFGKLKMGQSILLSHFKKQSQIEFPYSCDASYVISIFYFDLISVYFSQILYQIFFCEIYLQKIRKMFIKIKMFHSYKKSRGLANFSEEKSFLFIIFIYKNKLLSMQKIRNINDFVSVLIEPMTIHDSIIESIPYWFQIRGMLW